VIMQIHTDVPQGNRTKEKLTRTRVTTPTTILIILVIMLSSVAGCGSKTSLDSLLNLHPHDISVGGTVQSVTGDSDPVAMEYVVVRVEIVDNDELDNDERIWVCTTDEDGAYQIKVKWFKFATYRIIALTEEDLSDNGELEQAFEKRDYDDLDITVKLEEKQLADA